jgi:hypothetical protein
MGDTVKPYLPILTKTSFSQELYFNPDIEKYITYDPSHNQCNSNIFEVSETQALDMVHQWLDGSVLRNFNLHSNNVLDFLDAMPSLPLTFRQEVRRIYDNIEAVRGIRRSGKLDPRYVEFKDKLSAALRLEERPEVLNKIVDEVSLLSRISNALQS